MTRGNSELPQTWGIALVLLAGCSNEASGPASNPPIAGGSSGSASFAGAATSSGGTAGVASTLGGTASVPIPSGGIGSGGAAAGTNAGGMGGAGAGSVGGAGAPGGAGGAAGSAGSSSSSGAEPFVPGKPPAAAVHFKRGIALGNRLDAPNEGDWGATIRESDFPLIAARGFDHVRLPIRFNGHAQASAPYTLDATFMQRVDAVIAQARKSNLAVLVDFQPYDELHMNVAAERARFLGIWSQLSDHFQQLPDTVAFELLNEPHGQLDTAWNELLAQAVTTVRTRNPRRLLVVDAVFWADPGRLTALVLPNDANIMVAVHVYEPKLFSFQGKDWMGPPYLTTGIVFPGPPASPVTPVAAATQEAWSAQWFDRYNTLPAATNPSGPATLDAQLALVQSYASTSGRLVYNGEWGPQSGGDDTSRANLITAMRQRCESAGIPWAIWEDPTNMKLFDSTQGTWNTRLVDALLPR